LFRLRVARDDVRDRADRLREDAKVGLVPIERACKTTTPPQTFSSNKSNRTTKTDQVNQTSRKSLVTINNISTLTRKEPHECVACPHERLGVRVECQRVDPLLLRRRLKQNSSLLHSATNNSDNKTKHQTKPTTSHLVFAAGCHIIIAFCSLLHKKQVKPDKHSYFSNLPKYKVPLRSKAMPSLYPLYPTNSICNKKSKRHKQKQLLFFLSRVVCLAAGQNRTGAAWARETDSTS
jgi:hypothetical protein